MDGHGSIVTRKSAGIFGGKRLPIIFESLVLRRPDDGLSHDDMFAVECCGRRAIKLVAKIQGFGNTMAKRSIILAREQAITRKAIRRQVVHVACPGVLRRAKLSACRATAHEPDGSYLAGARQYWPSILAASVGLLPGQALDSHRSGQSHEPITDLIGSRPDRATHQAQGLIAFRRPGPCL